MFSCRYCSQSFLSSNTLDYHHRKLHQNFVHIAINDNRDPTVVKMVRNEGGCFVCCCKKQFTMPNKFREHVKGCGTFIDLYVVGPKESRIEAAKNNQDVNVVAKGNDKIIEGKEAVSSIAIDVDDEEDQDETRDDYGNDNDDNDNDDNTDRKDANNDNDKAKNNVQPQKNQISTDTINKLQDETALPSDYRSSFNLISSHPISVPALYPSLTPTPTPTPFPSPSPSLTLTPNRLETASETASSVARIGVEDETFDMKQECVWQGTQDNSCCSHESPYYEINQGLATYGLQILSIHAVSCVECGGLLDVEHVKSHMQNVHHVFRFEDEVENLFKQMNHIDLKSPSTVSNERSSSWETYPCIFGLPVLLNGYECTICFDSGGGFVHGIADTFYRHVRRHHGRTVNVNECMRRVSLQTVKNKSYQRHRYFKVDFAPVVGEDRNHQLDSLIDSWYLDRVDEDSDADANTNTYTNTYARKRNATEEYGDDNDSVDARQKNLLNQQLGWGAIVKALGRNWQGLIGWHYIDGAINSKIILEELIRYYYRGFQYLKWMMIGTRKLFTEGGNYSAQERGLNPLEQRVSVVNYARSTARYLMFLLRRPNCQKNGHVRSHLERMCRIVSAEAEAEAKAKQGGGRKRKRDESHLGKEATVEDEDAKVSEWIDTAIGDDDNDNDNDIIMMEEEALDESEEIERERALQLELEQQRQEEEAAGIQKDQNNDRGQQDGDDVDDDADEKEERRGFYFRKDEAYAELHEALKLAFLRQYEFSESIRDTEIVKFLACLSLRDDGTSRYAYEISSFFAPLIYTCRLVAASELQRLVEEGKVTLSSIPEFHTAGSFAYTHVFRYISLGKRNIYDILYEANKIVRDVTRTEGYANTLEGLNPSRVLFRPAFNAKYTIVGSHINNMVVLDLSDLSHLYESMFSRLQLLLEELCFGVDMEKLLPSSLLQSVGDDINNSKLGYSFFKESVDIRMTRSVLLRTVLKNDELRHRFLPLVSRDDFYDYFEELVQANKKKSQNGTQEQDWTDKEKEKEKKKGSRIEKKNDMSWMDDFDAVFKKDLKWSKTSILNYETKATKFNELLFCLVYISAGQPARAKEMVHWTLKNSKYKARELYLMFGRLMIYSRYDKTRNMKFAEKPIPRFLPESLSTLALRYYALVRPFQAFLSSVKTGNKQAAAVYTNAMFVVNGGKRLDSGMPYRIFPKVTYECLGKPLGFRNYRHIAHYFKERNLEEDMSKNSYFDLQAGHTRSTALLIYGRTMDKLHYLPADYFANFFRASFQWQELLKIKDNSAHGLLVEQCNPILKEIRESTKELKSMLHSAKQAVEEEGKEKQKGEEKSPKQKVCVSCFSATTTATATATKEQPSWSDTSSRGIPPSQIYVQLCRWALAQFCGLSAKFRSKKQFHSVYFSVQGQKNLIIVLPTASGKSLSFLLPALIDKTIRPNNTTLVVVPAISLREDMMRRVNETGLVECTNTWTQYRNQPVTPSLKLPDLFILTYESALSNSALAFFESLGVAGRLARVVVDEAHSLLTDSTWRNTLLQAPRLSALFAPIHLLSGTFPRPLETRASKTFGATFTVVRDISTARQNLLYLLRPLVANAFLNELSVLMQRASVYEGDGRVIVFCQKKHEVEYLQRKIQRSDLFPCTDATIYTGDLDEAERKKSFEKFRNPNGKTRIMVATKAFGLGIDYGEVRLVVHYGLPNSCMQYAQETGRAGRDGKYAIAALFYQEHDSVWSKHVDESMKMFMKDKTMCVRSYFAAEMDGDSDCCSSFENCVYCSRCAQMFLGESAMINIHGSNLGNGGNRTIDGSTSENARTAYSFSPNMGVSMSKGNGNGNGNGKDERNFLESSTPKSKSIKVGHTQSFSSEKEKEKEMTTPKLVSASTPELSSGMSGTTLLTPGSSSSIMHSPTLKKNYILDKPAHDKLGKDGNSPKVDDEYRVHSPYMSFQKRLAAWDKDSPVKRNKSAGMATLRKPGGYVGVDNEEDDDDDVEQQLQRKRLLEYKSRVQDVNQQLMDENAISASVAEFFGVSKDDCLFCLIMDPDSKLKQHQPGRCPIERSACFKCRKTDHGRAHCKMDVQFKGVCKYCGLTIHEHDSGDLGYTPECRSWARNRLIPLTYTAWNSRLFKKSIANEFLNGDTTDETFYKFVCTSTTRVSGFVLVIRHVLDEHLHAL